MLTISPLAAQAQSIPPVPRQKIPINGDLCGRVAAAAQTSFQQRLVGVWKTTHHTGFVFTPQTGLMAFPPSAPEPITLAFVDGALMATSGDGAQNVVLKPYDKTKWSFEKSVSASVLGSNPEPKVFSDVALMAGCSSVNKLPRLIGTTFINQQGVNMRFVIRLIVLSENVMHAILVVDGGVDAGAVSGGQATVGTVGFESWRSLTLMRIR